MKTLITTHALKLSKALGFLRVPRMKPRLALCFLAPSAAIAFGQGAVTLTNDASSLVILTTNFSLLRPADASRAGQPVGNTTPLPSGITLVAGLYGGTSSNSLFLYSTIPLTNTGCPAGSIPGLHIFLNAQTNGAPAIPGIVSGTPISPGTPWFQVRIWDAAFLTYEAAWQAGTYGGEGWPFQLNPSVKSYMPTAPASVDSTWTEEPIVVGGLAFPPTILISPTNQTAYVGDSVSFRVSAGGSPPLAYQWRYVGTNPLSGATTSVLQLTSVQLSQAGVYDVVVTNAYGAATSAPAWLTVVALPPTILISPTNQTAYLGDSVSFRVSAGGSPPLAYQWRYNGTTPLSGATTSVLQLNSVQLFQAGAHNVVVTNAYGAATSAPAWLTVVALPPTILISPTNQTTYVGDSVSFRVSAGGSPPLAYQWRYNGTTPLSGATTSVLQLNSVQLFQAGAYDVVVTNAYGAATSAPALLALFPPRTVTNCTETALRAAMARGGFVTFACDGIITLANTISNFLDTVLDASGHQVTISANGVRAFYVNSNASFTLMNLTVAGVSSTNSGAGMFIDGGTVNLIGVAFANNSVRSTNNDNAEGGAIRNELGTLNLQNCSFTGNGAYGEATYFWCPSGLGGAIYNNGTMNASGCTFGLNSASSTSIGPGWYGGECGFGGAIYNLGFAVIDGSTFSGNMASGGAARFDVIPGHGLYPGPSGGLGYGGAIFNWGQLRLRTTSFGGNHVSGGIAGDGSDTSHSLENPGPPGGGGGWANGGALYNQGTASIASSTFNGNGANGGAGGGGSFGASQGASGGAGGAGGDARGGAVFSSGSIELVSCTIAQNSASGGPGGRGGGGGSGPVPIGGPGGSGGVGGAASGFLWSENDQVAVTNCTIASNSGQGGAGGPGGAGGYGIQPGPPGAVGQNGTATGGFKIVGGQLMNTVLSSNAPTNCAGSITDAGHNLSSDATPLFTLASSRNNIDPRLGPLADNGGPTFTMALLPGSPAIDAGDSTSAPPTDQRGFPRYGPADIGAFEYVYWVRLQIYHPQGGGLDILASNAGLAGRTCRLLVSSDLTAWTAVAVTQLGTNTTFLFHDTPNTSPKFYRAM